MTTKVLSNFAKLSDSLAETRSAAVVAALTGNVNFPDIGTLLTDLAAEQAAYSDALALAKIGTPSQVADKNAKKAVLLAKLKDVADYVNFKAKGNRSVLLTTGFEPSKEDRTPIVLEPIKGFTVQYGSNPGSFDLSVKKGYGTRTVIFDYSLDESASADTVWNLYLHRKFLHNHRITRWQEGIASCRCSGCKKASIVQPDPAENGCLIRMPYS